MYSIAIKVAGVLILAGAVFSSASMDWSKLENKIEETKEQSSVVNYDKWMVEAVERGVSLETIITLKGGDIIKVPLIERLEKVNLEKISDKELTDIIVKSPEVGEVLKDIPQDKLDELDVRFVSVLNEIKGTPIEVGELPKNSDDIIEFNQEIKDQFK